MMCVNKNFHFFLIFFHAFFSAGFLGNIRAVIPEEKCPAPAGRNFKKCS